MADDYADFVKPEAPKNEALARLTVLVSEALVKEDLLETIASALKTAQEAYRSLVCGQIPALMKELGLEEVKLADGLKVEIKEDVQASIPEVHRAEAHKWLEDNEHGGLIKRDITVSFNRDQQDMADTLMAELSKTYAAVTLKKGVHASTLKAFVKEQLSDGKDVPIDLFGVFRQKAAKFSMPRAKK